MHFHIEICCVKWTGLVVHTVVQDAVKRRSWNVNSYKMVIIRLDTPVSRSVMDTGQ